MTRPDTLDEAGIRARVPHAARMCLLNAMLRWTDEHIDCTAINHREADNPLRSGGTLRATNAIEYAAQAMALHGSLCAGAGAAPTPGFLASVRGVTLHVARLDDVAGPLHIRASRVAGDTHQAQYAFDVRDGQRAPLVQGRATVVLNALSSDPDPTPP